MARPLRLEFPGAVYHVTSRGNGRQPVFLDDEDRRLFLRTLASVVALRRWVVHAFCLMGNHYHLLVETPEADLSRGMRSLNGEYTQSFNRRHGRCGHVFQGRYGAVVVEKQTHLLELCRYVVLNPVRARGMMVAEPGEWPWSSYRATAGAEAAPRFLNVDWVLEQFGGNLRQSRERYRRFVAEGERKRGKALLSARNVLGTERFEEALGELAAERRKIREYPRRERALGRPSLEALLSPQRCKTAKGRNGAMRKAYLEHGYAQAEIARHLGLHPGSVCRILKDSAPPEAGEQGERC